MNGLALPFFGALFVFGVVMPGLALVSKALLWLLQRRDTNIGLHGHGAIRYALIVAPTALPLGWFTSASLHQAEAGTDPGVCAVPDPPGVLCPEVAFFAAGLLFLVALAAVPRLVRERRALRGSTSPEAAAARKRVTAILAGDVKLSRIARRFVITESGNEPIATLGVFLPRLVIHTSFIRELDDGALLGAIRHEAEHVRDRDPLRYFLAWLALAANPVGGWLLRGDLNRWILARETHCDREAVLAGASAPALAHALVSAARFVAPTAAGSGLRASDAKVLRLRIDLLMAYADRRPIRCCRLPALRLAVIALVLAVVLPHHIGDEALDNLHRAAERAAFTLLTPNQD